MPNIIHLDDETRSHASIRDLGAYAYSAHPTTELICTCWAVGRGPVELMPLDDYELSPSCPFELTDDTLLYAHNAVFERYIWRHIKTPRYGWPEVRDDQWRCTAAVASYRGLPRSLDKGSEALRLVERKKKVRDGKTTLVNRMSRWLPATKRLPARYDEDPEKLKKLYEYCKQDVRTERAIYEELGDLSDEELKVFLLDTKMNSRGLPFDLENVEHAIAIGSQIEETMRERLTLLTGGRCTTGAQVARILLWLNENGLNISDLKEGTLRDVASGLYGTVDDKVMEVVSIRNTLSKASVKKFQAMRRRCPGGRAHGELVYHKAHTGRWAGSGIQVQNLYKSKLGKQTDFAIDCLKERSADLLDVLFGDPNHVLASCCRGMLRAPSGKKLIVADYAGVEGRGLAWAAGQQDLVEALRHGKDTYVDMAAKIYDKPPLRLKDHDKGVTERERAVGKQANLGCGYGMGWVRFQETVFEKEGIELSEGMARKTVDTFRSTYSHIKKWWYRLERAAMETVSTGRPTRVRTRNCSIRFRIDGKFLRVRLPSGRDLSYFQPIVSNVLKPWGEKAPGLSFRTLDDRGQLVRKNVFGGFLAENFVQAICRDLLVYALFELEREEYWLIATVHDEAISEVDEDFGSAEEMSEIMERLPCWAEGFPLKAVGYEAKRFRK